MRRMLIEVRSFPYPLVCETCQLFLSTVFLFVVSEAVFVEGQYFDTGRKQECSLKKLLGRSMYGHATTAKLQQVVDVKGNVVLGNDFMDRLSSTRLLDFPIPTPNFRCPTWPCFPFSSFFFCWNASLLFILHHTTNQKILLGKFFIYIYNFDNYIEIAFLLSFWRLKTNKKMKKEVVKSLVKSPTLKTSTRRTKSAPGGYCL